MESNSTQRERKYLCINKCGQSFLMTLSYYTHAMTCTFHMTIIIIGLDLENWEVRGYKLN